MLDYKFQYGFWSTDHSMSPTDWDTVGQATFRASHGVELDIPVGCLLDQQPDENGTVSYGYDPIVADSVYGFCSNGDRITLVDVSTAGPDFSAPGTMRETLHASSALVARREFVDPNPILSGIQLKIAGLWNWVNHPLGKVCLSFDNNSWAGTSASWTVDDLKELPLYEADDVRITLIPKLTKGGGRLPEHDFVMKYDYELKIDLMQSPLQLDKAMDTYVYPVWRFLIFCMGYRCAIQDLALTTLKGTKVRYYAPFADAVENPSNSELGRMPLPYDKLLAYNSNALDAWMGMSGDAKRAAIILTGTLGNKSLNMLGPLFVTIASAFEAISRVGEKTTDLDEKKFEELRDQLLSQTESDEDREWLRRKLSNLPPARYYAESLLDKLGSYARYVVPDTTRFLRDHRNTRNGYIHLTSHLDEKSTLDGNSLYIHSVAVELLCYGAIMLQLGLTPDEALESLRKSRYEDYGVYKARQMYSIV